MEILKRIDRTVKQHPITAFIKGTPDHPMCAGSAKMVDALKACNAECLYINLQTEPEIRAYLPKFTDFPSFPQLYLQGQFIGGADVVDDLHQRGDLEMMVVACLQAGEAA